LTMARIREGVITPGDLTWKDALNTFVIAPAAGAVAGPLVLLAPGIVVPLALRSLTAAGVYASQGRGTTAAVHLVFAALPFTPATLSALSGKFFTAADAGSAGATGGATMLGLYPKFPVGVEVPPSNMAEFLAAVAP